MELEKNVGHLICDFNRFRAYTGNGLQDKAYQSQNHVETHKEI